MRILLFALACLLAAAPSAHGASAFVGHPTDTDPDAPIIGAADGTAVQLEGDAFSYAVPFTGVVTAWRINGDDTGGEAKLRAFRGDGVSVAESPLATIAPGLNGVFIPAGSAMPVQAGDLIGVTTDGFTNVYAAGPTSDEQARRWSAPDPSGMSSPSPGNVNAGALVETDFDGDRRGDDSQDTDDDNDGAADTADAFPLNPAESRDTDRDGTGDNADPDDDNDGAADAVDLFPLNPGEQRDSDRDGIGDNADPDDDNDGFPDTTDAFPFDVTRAVIPDGGVSLSRRAVSLDRRGRVKIRVACATGTPGGCRGTLTLVTASRVEVAAKRRLRLGSARFRASAGRSATATVRLSRSAQRVVRRLRSVRVRATARTQAGSATSTLLVRR